MFMGEVVGTAVLILLGDGVVAGVLLNKSKAQNAGWIVITWAWGLAVFMGVLTSIAVTDGVAHLNPAVTIGLASVDLVEGGGVALLVVVIGMSLGGPTGYAINPARDLGPRIMHFVLPIAGKGDSDWSYSWGPVVGPIIGGGS